MHLGRGPQPARGSSSWTPVILTAPAARPQLPQRHPHDGRSHEEAAAQRHSDKRTNRWASLAAFTTCPGSAGAERRGPGLGQGHCHPDPEAGTAPGRGLRKARGAIFQNCDPGRLHRGAEPRSRLSRVPRCCGVCEAKSLFNQTTLIFERQDSPREERCGSRIDHRAHTLHAPSPRPGAWLDPPAPAQRDGLELHLGAGR